MFIQNANNEHFTIIFWIIIATSNFKTTQYGTKLVNDYCPLSFRTVDSIDYKKAMLVFYEQNNIVPFKDIFISQYQFAVGEYF